MSKPLCIYHGGCADGFTAAWAVWRRFGDTFDYYPGIYQLPPPDVCGRDVVFVDFSYKRAVVEQMRGRTGTAGARSILVLDHHKSAADDLAHRGGNFGIDLNKYTGGLTWERHLANVHQDECEGVGDSVYTLFDMNRSGAGIAWDFFHPGEKRPTLINYVEDRDLWRFVLPGSRNISAFVFSYPYEFGAWDEMARFIESAQPEAERAGAAIEQKHHKDVAELVAENRREMTIGGHVVPVCNLPKTLTSDAGNLMCKTHQSAVDGAVYTPAFAACYWDAPQGRVFSLRSIEGGADVSEIAKQYGGGGHKNAAGFTLPHGVNP